MNNQVADFGDNDLISLTDAPRLFFQGRLTKSALRTEARKGNLEIIRIANKDFVTRDGINRMIERCRKSADQQDYGSGQTHEHGSSRTEAGVSPRDAAKEKLRQLRQSLPDTSPANTSRSAAVVRLRSQ